MTMINFSCFPDLKDWREKIKQRHTNERQDEFRLFSSLADD